MNETTPASPAGLSVALPAAPPARVRLAFYAGVFLLCQSVLMLQVVQTRILSVMAYYHLAFLSISMGMFGLTLGALWVQRRGGSPGPGELFALLSRLASGYAIAVAICLCFEAISFVGFVPSAAVAFVWLQVILLIAAPFCAAGAAISLALTRSPFPIGTVYGVDLAGAASGCLLVLGLLQLLDGPSAAFAVAAVGAAGGVCFRQAARWAAPGAATAKLPGPITLATLATIALLNASTPHGVHLLFSKGVLEERDRFAVEMWNSFSRVVALRESTGTPFLWGPSPRMPREARIEQRLMSIDGEAGTPMYRFSGSTAPFDFLRYDVTNLAYAIRSEGRAAVIGVGGGRDILSAHVAGFRDITAVELNPSFVRLLTDPALFRGFAGLADLPHVRLNVAEARSWFGRTRERFDLIQMSMVDTWAATGAGAFSLSENGLYTVEAWVIFLRSLTERGVLTVSRWYSPDNVDETGRAVSLAIGALFALGVEDPRDHIFLVGQKRLSTLVVSRRKLAAEDVAGLVAAARTYEHDVLLSPDRPPATPLLADLLAARDPADLAARSDRYVLDLTPPTDARPFFFNQLRLTRPGAILNGLDTQGVVVGNVIATATLLLIVLLSGALVAGLVLWPSLGSMRGVERRLVTGGSAYFLLIGLGFMFVEIALLQRISIFLGHPILGLGVVLFSIILSTGLGSLASERATLDTAPRLAVWAAAIGVYLLLLPAWMPTMLRWFESSGLVVQSAAAVAAIAPAGLLMGFGFPTGMRLVTAIDARPTPWLWGLNGAAGVLASGLAVACSIAFSIDATMRVGAVCYLLLAPVALLLLRRERRSPPA